MKIGIIGAKGFIGGRISVSLLGKHEVYMILREDWKDIHYDIIIDANGNSLKHLAQTDPEYDFEASVKSVMHHINNLNYDKYIYISSIDAEMPWESNYGFHRSLAEALVRQYCPNWTIVRLCSVVGEKMTKGIVHDVLMGVKLFVKRDSLIQVIPVQEVARKISQVLVWYDKDILRFYSKGSIEVSEICEMFGTDPLVSQDAQTQLYDYDPSDLGFKTAEEYLKETFYERMV